MKQKIYIMIGRITRLHGVRGEVFLSFKGGVIAEELFNLLQGQALKITYSVQPLFKKDHFFDVLKCRPHKQGLIVQLRGVDSVDKALVLKAGFVFVEKDIFCSSKGDDIYLCEVLQWEVWEQSDGLLGKVIGFSYNGAQDLLQVQGLNGVLREIPFIKPFVLDLDFKAQKLKVHLPKGWPTVQVKKSKG